MTESARRPGQAHAAVVIPFYNEESRFDRARLAALAKDPAVELVLVDDGSRDRTPELLRELEGAGSGKIQLLALDVNGGKGEAVRRGMQLAIERGNGIVGFTDADFSTRPEELLELTRRSRVVPISTCSSPRACCSSAATWSAAR